MSVQSDDVVAAGLRLLWQLDTFLAEIDANRLDEISNADRETLHGAFVAAAATVIGMRDRLKPAQKEPVKLTGTS
jgi:hypothetical protein